MRAGAALLAGLVLGAGLAVACGKAVPAASALAPGPRAPEHPLQVTLHRFELKGDKLGRFDDWMAFQHRTHRQTVATLERERMYVEAIFRDRTREPGVIYWLTVAGEGGGHTETSPLSIDRAHAAYMDEVLKPGSHTQLDTENVLIPDFVLGAVAAHQRLEKMAASAERR